MTLEGYLMILLLVLALLKITQTKSWSPLFKKIKTTLSSRLGIELSLFFAISLTLSFLINDLIIALIAFNSIVWTAFYYLLKKFNYPILAWLGLLTFLLLSLASNLNFVKLPHTELWFNSLLSWEISLIAWLIYDTLGKITKIIPSILSWFLFAIPIIVSAIYIAYNLNFNSVIEVVQINALFQTNYFEIREFIEMFVPWNWILGFLILLFLTLLLLINSEFKIKKKLDFKWFTTVILILIVMLNLNVFNHLQIFSEITKAYTTYSKELAIFRKELEKRKIDDGSIEAIKKEGKELYIIVIGESLNKHHMSLYGYHRNTTPRLLELHKKKKILKFDQVFSPHTHTVPVLTKALTSSNQINNINYTLSPSIVDLFEKAGFESYWITNQLSYGGWDNPITAIADAVDNKFSTNGNLGENTETSSFDELLVQSFESIVSKKIEHNTVVFIHMMGSHTGYYQRYPEQYEIFQSELTPAYYGLHDYKRSTVNHYDNSILYNDEQLYKIISICDTLDGFAAGLYFSDHGEEVFLQKGHNSGVFTFDMTEIPMIFWASDTYVSKNEDLVNTLYENKNKLFSIEYLFDLMLNISGIKSNIYTPRLDLSNRMYDVKPDESLIISGSQNYTDEKNLFYHQRRNAHKIDSLNISDRIIPHRVNTIGKLSEASYEGMRGIEVDLMFRSNTEGTYFEIGHDESTSSGMKFEDMLLYSENLQIDKIWMDIKNINQNNLKEVIDRLTSLDLVFGIKERSIVETGYTNADFNQVSDLGFQTSYYIPKSISDLNFQKQKEKAHIIAQQVKNQKMTAVSFDAVLYPFVKELLEPMLSDSIIFHTWDLSLQMKDPLLIDKLTSKKYYNDDRLKTILVRYSTNFEL